MAVSLPSARLSARIIALMAIAFISLFALDSFGSGKPFWNQILAFLIHLIPSFFLLIIFFIACKWEHIGGIMFILIGIANAPWIYKNNYAMNHSAGLSILIVLMLLSPFIISGILFLVSYFRSRKARGAL